MKRLRSWRNSLSAFRRHEGGNVALMTGLMMVPLAGVLFTSVEFADDVAVRQDLQHATDEAALAALVEPQQGWRQRQKTARRLFLANFDREDRVEKLRWRLTRRLTPAGLTVRYSARAKLQPLFGGLTPFGERTMVVESAAIRYHKGNRPPRLISTKATSVLTRP